MKKAGLQKARFEELYNSKIRPDLQKKLGIKNIMEVPKVSKIVLNVGLGKDAIADSKIIPGVMATLEKISGQAAVRTLARKSIAGFKLREGMPLGAKVTLRKKNMYEFLDKLINLALPKTRDFQGVSTALDGRGNYNLGLKEVSIFPEVEYDINQKMYGLNVTICTTARSNEHGLELLREFGMPFRKHSDK
jgi:large subunit ribosomal protein L5